MTHWTEDLRALNACEEAIEWARQYDSLQAAWDACERGDWMLWLLKHARTHDQQKLVRIAAASARLALPYVEPGEERPLVAIEAAERWADDPSEANRAAAKAALAADWAAKPAACAAARAAARAADWAADWADWAANWAAWAAWAAAAAAEAAARAATLELYADIVRKHYPQAPRLH